MARSTSGSDAAASNGVAAGGSAIDDLHAQRLHRSSVSLPATHRRSPESARAASAQSGTSAHHTTAERFHPPTAPSGDAPTTDRSVACWHRNAYRQGGRNGCREARPLRGRRHPQRAHPTFPLAVARRNGGRGEPDGSGRRDFRARRDHRAGEAARPTKEDTVHPVMLEQLAAERVKDMLHRRRRRAAGRSGAPRAAGTTIQAHGAARPAAHSRRTRARLSKHRDRCRPGRPQARPFRGRGPATARRARPPLTSNTEAALPARAYLHRGRYGTDAHQTRNHQVFLHTSCRLADSTPTGGHQARQPGAHRSATSCRVGRERFHRCGHFWVMPVRNAGSYRLRRTIRSRTPEVRNVSSPAPLPAG